MVGLDGTGRAREAVIDNFWQSHPCGDASIGGLAARYEFDYERFFRDYDESRYAVETHIPSCLDRLPLQGARVLEIGLGQGAESEQLIRRGARWTGLDLTEESVQRVRSRLQLHRLPFEDVVRGSATKIPFAGTSFDLVFSHGVLHHVPDIIAAQREIHRVLRPGGSLVAMVYARRSLNYWFAIAVLRRCALVALWPMRNRRFGPLLDGQLDNARRVGLLRYLRMDQFIHANTDGPGNPFSRVYDLRRIRQDFPSFSVVAARKYFMHAPPLPVHGLPGGRMLGWHLWVQLEPRPVAAGDGEPAGQRGQRDRLDQRAAPQERVRAHVGPMSTTDSLSGCPPIEP